VCLRERERKRDREIKIEREREKGTKKGREIERNIGNKVINYLNKYEKM